MYPKSYLLLILACLPVLLFSQYTRFGLKGGLIEFIIPDKRAQFQLEVLYTGNGTIIRESDISQRMEINISQLAVPLILKYEVTRDWSFISGSYFGYILNAKEKDRFGGSINAKNDFQLFDFGLLAGFELRVNQSLSFDVRYNFGLLNFNNSEYYAGMETERQYKNRTVNYGAVYKF